MHDIYSFFCSYIPFLSSTVHAVFDHLFTCPPKLEVVLDPTGKDREDWALPPTSWSSKILHQPTILFANFVLFQCTCSSNPTLPHFFTKCFLHLFVKFFKHSIHMYEEHTHKAHTQSIPTSPRWYLQWELGIPQRIPTILHCFERNARNHWDILSQRIESEEYQWIALLQ